MACSESADAVLDSNNSTAKRGPLQPFFRRSFRLQDHVDTSWKKVRPHARGHKTLTNAGQKIRMEEFRLEPENPGKWREANDVHLGRVRAQATEDWLREQNASRLLGREHRKSTSREAFSDRYERLDEPRCYFANS